MALTHDTISRRRFLAGSSALAVGAGLAPLVPLARAQEARRPSEAAWRHLADTLSGPLFGSGRTLVLARSFISRYFLLVMSD